MLEIIRLPEVLVESRPAIAFDPSNVSVGRDRFEALKYAANGHGGRASGPVNHLPVRDVSCGCAAIRSSCAPSASPKMTMPWKWLGIHDESVHIDKRILLGQATPGIVKHASGIVQMHLAISNFTE